MVIITGCAHPGVLRMVEEALNISRRKVALLLGGFHLGGASPKEIRGIIGRLKALGVERVAPCHCNGDLTIGLFKGAYGEAFIEASVGKSIIEHDLK